MKITLDFQFKFIYNCIFIRLAYKVKKPAAGSTIVLHCNLGGLSGKALQNLESNHSDIWSAYNFKHFNGGVKKWNELKNE